MEKAKRRKMLLIAFVLGIGIVVFWVVFLMPRIPGMMSAWAGEEVLPLDMEDIWGGRWLMSLPEFFSNLVYFANSSSLILSIPVFILNLVSLFREGPKKILVTGILYLISLNLPSAVLCFISFASIRKQNLASSALPATEELGN